VLETVIGVIAEFITIAFQVLFEFIVELLFKGTWKVITRIGKYAKNKILTLIKWLNKTN
jgi:hypothetical protein